MQLFDDKRMENDFTDLVVLITGAAAGLGHAYALWLAARGARVVANNRVHAGRPTGARDVVAKIKSAGGVAIVDDHDIIDTGSGTAMVEAALSAFGRIDAVIANAASNVRKSALEIDEAEMRRSMVVWK